jgi:hypothetical protein
MIKKDEKYAQLIATGELIKCDSGSTVEFYWSGGDTLLMTDEFLNSDASYIEHISNDCIRVGSFILDIIERLPEYKLVVAQIRTGRMP